MTGIVKSYDERKGYGFIQPLIGKPDTTPRIFFHISNVHLRNGLRPQAIPVGAEVRFILVRGDKGPQACEVELLELPTSALIATKEENAVMQTANTVSNKTRK